MSTLTEIWNQDPRIVTNVAKRPNGPYVSLAHENYEDALNAARKAQVVTIADAVADDWSVAEAP